MESPGIVQSGSGVVAVRKPAGLATQAPPGIASLEHWVRSRLGLGSSGYLGVPHRLDRAVSGVVLFAATPRAARVLSRQFERRQVAKIYLAVVEPPAGGADRLPPDGQEQEWRDFVRKVNGQPRGEVVDAAAAGAREAVTRVRVLHHDGAAAGRVLLWMEPLTGRMHQLRLQSAVRGAAIAGDELYGGAAVGSAGPRERPILLHAWRISYSDPDTGERLAIEAPLPGHWPDWARPA